MISVVGMICFFFVRASVDALGNIKMSSPPYPYAYERLQSFDQRWGRCHIPGCISAPTMFCKICKCFAYCGAVHYDTHQRVGHTAFMCSQMIRYRRVFADVELRVREEFVSDECMWRDNIVKKAYELGLVASQPCMDVMYLSTETTLPRSKHASVIQAWPQLLVVKRAPPLYSIYISCIDSDVPAVVMSLVQQIHEFVVEHAAESPLAVLLTAMRYNTAYVDTATTTDNEEESNDYDDIMPPLVPIPLAPYPVLTEIVEL